MKISEILAKYETDKEWYHRYGRAYDHIFTNFDKNAPLNILEVGTQKGGSLLAWKEFFPNANVTGVDIVDVVPDKYRLDTVTRLIADIKDVRFEGNFDIVIDDGSHYLADVVYVISQYIVKLNRGGVMIIEDVRNPELLRQVISNLLQEFGLGFPDYTDKTSFIIREWDNTTKETPESYLLAMFKNL